MATSDSERLYALSRLLALEAGRSPEVIAFRERYVGGGTMPWDEIGEWISARALEDGEHSQYVEIVLPFGASARATVSGMVIESLTPLADVRVEDTVRAKFVRYGLPGQDRVKVVPVRAGGVLDALRTLSQRLSRSFGWTDDQAVVFTLSGVTPLLVDVRMETRVQSEHPAASRVTLVIDPVTSPPRILELYATLRRKVLKGTYRPLRRKHLLLAVFAAERRPPAKWAEVMQAWNEEHKEYEYEKVTLFARDCTAAQRRLLHPRLNPDALLK
jgi:hypothetical protein